MLTRGESEVRGSHVQAKFAFHQEWPVSDWGWDSPTGQPRLTRTSHPALPSPAESLILADQYGKCIWNLSPTLGGVCLEFFWLLGVPGLVWESRDAHDCLSLIYVWAFSSTQLLSSLLRSVLRSVPSDWGPNTLELSFKLETPHMLTCLWPWHSQGWTLIITSANGSTRTITTINWVRITYGYRADFLCVLEAVHLLTETTWGLILDYLLVVKTLAMLLLVLSWASVFSSMKWRNVSVYISDGCWED